MPQEVDNGANRTLYPPPPPNQCQRTTTIDETGSYTPSHNNQCNAANDVTPRVLFLIGRHAEKPSARSLSRRPTCPL